MNKYLDLVAELAAADLPKWEVEPVIGVPTPAAVQAAGAPPFEVVTRQNDGTHLLASCKGSFGCVLSASAVHPPDALAGLAARWVVAQRRDLAASVAETKCLRSIPGM